MLVDKQGYHIEYSNNEKYPCWIVMRWQQVLTVASTKEEAECFLRKLKGGDSNSSEQNFNERSYS